MNDIDLNNRVLRERAVKAAQGKIPYDALIHTTRVLDLITGQLRYADIGIVGGLIVSVHKPNKNVNAEAIIDGENAIALPGLIDTHMHIESSMVTPGNYAEAVLPSGVTTVMWDPHEFANTCGITGVEYAVEACRDLPLRVLTLAPTCVPSAPGYESCGGDFTPKVLEKLLARPEICGAAEIMTMHPLLQGDKRASDIIHMARLSGKRICGHARGLIDQDLNAYAAAGAETDHELTSADDLIARLRTGMIVELRGSHEHLLPEFSAALLDLGHLPSTVTLCTDDVFPDDLKKKGGLIRLIQLLIEYGLPPLWVYRAATLNASLHIQRKDLGLIVPGRRADIFLVSDLFAAKQSRVFVEGKEVARDGKLLISVKKTSAPVQMRDTIHCSSLSTSDFKIKASGSKALIATLSQPRFTEWGERLCSVQEGEVILPNDTLRMAVINRYGAQTPVRLAVLENWGEWTGAFATSFSHDSHNLTIFGRDKGDMSIAANHVRKSKGGMVVVKNSQILAELSLPVAGLVSEENLEYVAEKFAKIRSSLDELVEWQPPYLTFKALFSASLVCNAGPRLSDIGIVDPFREIILKDCIIN